MTIDAPTDGEIFYQYVKCILLPALRPGDIVVFDNLSSHKQKRVFALIGVAGGDWSCGAGGGGGDARESCRA
jgi:hypothetical protein